MHADDTFSIKTMSFGRLLRHLRVRRLCTIGELARAASLAKSCISQLEHGSRRPGFRALRQLSAALQLTEDEFAVFCDVALAQAEPHMKELPDPNSSLHHVLGGPRNVERAGFKDLNLPPVSAAEEQFLREVKRGANLCSPVFADVHPSSQVFPTPERAGVAETDAL